MVAGCVELLKVITFLVHILKTKYLAKCNDVMGIVKNQNSASASKIHE